MPGLSDWKFPDRGVEGLCTSALLTASMEAHELATAAARELWRCSWGCIA
jgi:hypothetical protein